MTSPAATPDPHPFTGGDLPPALSARIAATVAATAPLTTDQAARIAVLLTPPADPEPADQETTP